jgi:hypothetical protein
MSSNVIFSGARASAVTQLAQNLHEIVGRDGLHFRESLNVREPIAPMDAGELCEDTAGVINFNGELHCLAR